MAVQASRLSTALHQQGKPGEFQDINQYHASKLCPNPYKVFCANSMLIKLMLKVEISLMCLERSSSTTRVLLFLAIPGHLTFVFIISRLAADQTRLSILFVVLYIIAALIQVRSNS